MTSSEGEGWSGVEPVTAPGIHDTSGFTDAAAIPLPTPQELRQWGADFVEGLLRAVVKALAGVFTPDLSAFEQLQDWAADVNSLVADVVDRIKEVLNDLLSMIFGGVDFFNLPTPGEFWEAATSVFNPGTIQTSVVAGIGGAANIGEAVQQTIDNAVQAITNTIGSGFNLDDLFDVFKTQQDQIAGINAGMAALQADQTGSNNNGVSASVSFSGVPDTTDLAQFGFTKVQDTGTSVARVVTEALDMFYSEGAGTETWLYTNDTLDSDYFEVSMVMPRRSDTPGLFQPSNESYTELVGRSNASGSRRCVLRTYYNSVRVGTVVDGTYTQFGSIGNYTVPAGAYVTFRGGTLAGVRNFQILINNQLKHTTNDTGSVSYAGSSYRHCGWTLNTDGEYRPNNMSIWTMNDNAPVATVGVGFFHAYRANTASTAQNNNSFAAFSSNTLDTVDAITADMSWSSSSQTLTVGESGRYMVAMREQLEDGAPENNAHYCGVIYTSGGVTRNRYGNGWRSSSLSSSPNLYNNNDMLGGMPIVLNLAAGDTIRPGHNLDSNTNGVIGDADGVQTWFTVTKIG